MTVLRMTAAIYVEAPDGTDPEEVATTMDGGMERALESFPGPGDVIHAAVEGISVATQAELEDAGLVE